MTRSFGRAALLLVAGVGFGGCQPWTGNYEAIFSLGPVSGQMDSAIVQATPTQLTVTLDVRLEGVPGECHFTTSECPGTVLTGPPTTFSTGDCTMAVIGACEPAWGSAFSSSISGTETSPNGGVVDSYAIGFGYFPPDGGPITFPVDLDRLT